MNVTTQVYSGLVGLRMKIETYLHAKLGEVEKETKDIVDRTGYRWNRQERERVNDLNSRHQRLRSVLHLVAMIFP